MVHDRKAVGVCKNGMHPRTLYPRNGHAPTLPSNREWFNVY